MKRETKRFVEHWQIVAICLMLYDFAVLCASWFLALWIRFDFVFTAIGANYLAAYKSFVLWYAVGSIIIGILDRLGCIMKSTYIVMKHFDVLSEFGSLFSHVLGIFGNGVDRISQFKTVIAINTKSRTTLYRQRYTSVRQGSTRTVNAPSQLGISVVPCQSGVSVLILLFHSGSSVSVVSIGFSVAFRTVKRHSGPSPAPP